MHGTVSYETENTPMNNVSNCSLDTYDGRLTSGAPSSLFPGMSLTSATSTINLLGTAFPGIVCLDASVQAFCGNLAARTVGATANVKKRNHTRAFISRDRARSRVGVF